ncbi:MAG TPA: hypothetical protein VLE99_03110 [Candidatus Saccharimonadales bacterium]|nr:hypothetical protein [Candidatus Saccharimonadales bacterium]
MGSLEGDALVERMRSIAREGHHGQEHSFGDGSYFDMHVEPVAWDVRRLGYGATYIATAYGHDLFEDTAVTAEDLSAERIPTVVIHGIELVTKQGKLTPAEHEAYLEGILTDWHAIVAKYADSSRNFAWTILNSPHISDEKFAAWSLEYAHNLAVLRPALPPLDR